MAASGDWLEQLNVAENVKQILRREQVDRESFLLLEKSDLQELGIPFGPQKLLLKAIAEMQAELDAAENGDEAADGASLDGGEDAGGAEAEVEEEVAVPDVAPPAEVALEDSGTAQREMVEGSESGGTVVEFRCPNVGLDMAGVKVMLGHTLAMQLEGARPRDDEEEGEQRSAVLLAYDQQTHAFRNVIYLRFVDKKAALKAAQQLNRTVFSDSTVTNALSSKEALTVGGSAARILKHVPHNYSRDRDGARDDFDGKGEKGKGKGGKGKGKGKKGGKGGKGKGSKGD